MIAVNDAPALAAERELECVHEIPVVELLQNIVWSIDTTLTTKHNVTTFWDEWFQRVVDDEWFPTIVDTLERDGFLIPISVCVLPPYYVKNGEGWTMGNGHHRLAAAILLGMETVPVFLSASDVYATQTSGSSRQDEMDDIQIFAPDSEVKFYRDHVSIA